jgi:hypothetical protein
MSLLEDKANQVAAEIQGEVNPTVAFDPATILAIIGLITQIIKLYQGCKQSPSEAADAMKEPNWWQRWRLRRLANQVVRQSGAKDVVVSHVVEGVLKQGKIVTVEEVEVMYKEVR